MDIGMQILEWRSRGLAAIDAVPADDLYNIWLGSGALLAVALLWFSYHVMRKALGHVKFRGTWYDEHQWEEMIKMIDEDCKRGNRVMRHDEMRALRVWRFGSGKAMFEHNSKSYF